MKLSAPLLMVGLGLMAIPGAHAKVKTPKSENANVQRASRKSKKGFKATKYKAPKASKKMKGAKYGKTHPAKHA
jgi:hypothetical protein